MTAKMKGVWALSTSCKCNKNCQRNAQIPGSICQHCYAQQIVTNYIDAGRLAKRNYEILTTKIIPTECWPYLGGREIFRIEALGDLENEIQAENYLNFIERNPDTTFAWWTKNPWILERVFKRREKPHNVILIQSALFVNRNMKPSYPFIDKVFTVYDKDHIREHGIEINCGARSCDTCRLCYTHNDVVNVREMLK